LSDASRMGEGGFRWERRKRTRGSAGIKDRGRSPQSLTEAKAEFIRNAKDTKDEAVRKKKYESLRTKAVLLAIFKRNEFIA